VPDENYQEMNASETGDILFIHKDVLGHLSFYLFIYLQTFKRAIYGNSESMYVLCIVISLFLSDVISSVNISCLTYFVLYLVRLGNAVPGAIMCTSTDVKVRS